MLISYNNIKSKINLSVEDLCNNLVQLGHEVETVTKLDMPNVVVGEIVGLEKHPNSEHLNVTKVVVVENQEPLQIVCGAPNVSLNQKVIVALSGAKLGELEIKPTTIRDVESNGMLCALDELGIDKSLLNQEDLDNIFTMPKNAPIGSNVFDILSLSDTIIEVSLTANRGDCQSYVGLIRDLAAIEKLKYAPKTGSVESEIENPYVVKIGDEKTKQLSCLVMSDVNVVDSPMQLKSWLIKHEIKPQNIFVDVANYCMFTLGVPMHTYDADKISGGIMTQTLEKEQQFVGLDEVEYNLMQGALIVRDQEKIISIASVLGSNATKITKATKNILLEVGLFDPTLVRKSAAMIRKKTDASIRGEKNIDEEQLQNAFFTYVKMIEKFQDTNYSMVTTVQKAKNSQDKLTLKFSEVKNVLGIEIEKKEIVQILTSLGFEPTAVEESVLVKIPSWRFDIENDHDLIEEVIRVYSMEKVEITDVLPTFTSKDLLIKDNAALIQRNAESLMLGLGLDQVVTYSLIEENRINEFTNAVNPVRLMMPLSKNHEYYRQSLLPSLIDVVKYNFSRQETQAQIFEIGNTYQMHDDEIIEHCLMSGVVTGLDSSNSELTFLDAKAYVVGFLENYFTDFVIQEATEKQEELNPYAHAEILVDGQVIGLIATVHPNYFTKAKHPIHVFEMNLSLIYPRLTITTNYQKVSTSFKTTRDITFKVPRDNTYAQSVNVFENINYLTNVVLKDTYMGENVAVDQKALTFTLEFFEYEGVSNEQVEVEFEKIVMNVQEAGYVFNY